jgi:CheY-like chemotaxis protein
MGLWVPFLFGAGVGALLGFVLGRARRAPGPPPPPPTPRVSRPDVRRVALDDNAANVLNSLNNRLAAIAALADLLQGATLDAERTHALTTLHGEVRRAAEITRQFLELTEHPAGAAEPADVALVLQGLLVDRDVTVRELGVKVIRNLPNLPFAACPAPQLTEMFGRLFDFALRRLRDTRPPREMRIELSETGPSLTVSMWDSGPPLSPEAEQRLSSPFRFTHAGGGGEVEFALARALAQSASGTVRLRPRGAAGAEVVVTLPKTALAPVVPAPVPPRLPKLRILLVDDDVVNRDAMELLLEREGHEVTAAEDGVDAIRRLGPSPTRLPFDVVLTDLQMPKLGGRALWEQLQGERPDLARRFVFVTGDRARDETRRFLEECGQPAVMKPYALGELLTAIAVVARA